jgi:hypothetical protein
MSFLARVSHQVIELRQHIELMKVRSVKERVTLYLDLNSGPYGRRVNLRGQLQDVASELGHLAAFSIGWLAQALSD